MILKLALRNVFSRKSSAVIVAFVAVTVALLLFINSVFDSTENGVQQSFTQSFTGDFILRTNDSLFTSLFGNDTPIIGELSSIEPLKPYPQILQALANMPQIESTASQLTCLCRMETGKGNMVCYAFGVEPASYFSVMKGLKMLKGGLWESGGRGIALNEEVAKTYGADIDSEIQFTVADGNSIRIRSAKVTGIYEYPDKNQAQIMDRIVLADYETVSSLLDLNSGTETLNIEEDKTDLLDWSFSESSDWEDLFFSGDETEDVETTYGDTALDSLWGAHDEEGSASQLLSSEDTSFSPSSWHFILGKLKDPSKTDRIIRKINRTFKKNGWPVEAVNWRGAAGSNALYLYWMRFILNIGVIIILATGFIIINNSLVINVLNKASETGTIRACGGTRRFVAMECMAETVILGILSGIVGVILGIGLVCFTGKLDLKISNAFLIQLFGSQVFAPSVSTLSVVKAFFMAVIVGLVGWIYPVASVLKVNPVTAISGAE